MSYKDNYGFFYKAKQTVYKWWCVVYKPAYKLFHHGYWPAEKEPYYELNQAKQAELNAEKLAQTASAQDLADQILSSKQGNIDALVANTPVASSSVSATSHAAISASSSDTETEPEVDLSKVDPDALARANEIMARLASEAAADEAKKQAEIEAAKAKAAEDAKLASILQSTKVDISAFIEEGKAQSNKEAAQLESILQSTKVDISAFIEEGKAQRQDS
ncbi:MAG: hypothetical protein IJZ96_03320 [Lachnospiraceae bacterium]|nr:hypothetical protein [Lachnospiraceae bacterium]